VEWFNLAKRHGPWQFLLHDDFYDEDGTALQPECEVVTPELYPSPVLGVISDDPEKLLDYTITRWHFEEVASAWNKLSPSQTLKAISLRFADTGNAGIKSVMLDVASTLGEQAEGFVRYAWGDFPETVDLPSLAKASASCLPHREGFDRVVESLGHCEESKKRDLMFSLSYFRSPETLDWIEANIVSPVTEAWGRLAAVSELDWPRVRRWLGNGRPLSLVALDALAAIVRPQTPLLREFAPRLNNPPDVESLTTVLKCHANQDPVPRVSRITGLVLENAGVLTKGG